VGDSVHGGVLGDEDDVDAQGGGHERDDAGDSNHSHQIGEEEVESEKSDAWNLREGPMVKKMKKELCANEEEDVAGKQEVRILLRGDDCVVGSDYLDAVAAEDYYSSHRAPSGYHLRKMYCAGRHSYYLLDLQKSCCGIQLGPLPEDSCNLAYL